MLDVKVIREYHKRWPEVIESVNRKFLPEAGQVVLTNAQRNLRANGSVQTGNLRSSLTYKVKGDVVSVGTNVSYAPYVEYGTYKSAAKPYLRPALDQNRRELVGRWRSLFRKTFRALGKL